MNMWLAACGTQDSSTNTTRACGHLCWEMRTKGHSLCHTNWPPHLGHPGCFGWNRKSASTEKQEKKLVNKNKSGINEEESFEGIKHKVIMWCKHKKLWNSFALWVSEEEITLALKVTFLSSELQISTSWVASPPFSYAPNVPGEKNQPLKISE